MTTDSPLSMTRSVFHNNSYGPFHIDWEYAKEWTMDTVARRTVAVVAIASFLMAIVLIITIPLMTSVHGQSARTPLEQEVEDLRVQLGKLDQVPAQMAVVIAHQQLEDQRYQEQQQLEQHMLWGFFATVGGITLAVVGWALSQFGITFGAKQQVHSRSHR